MSRCKSCGAEIVWQKTPSGKNIPMNLNGVCHFETCPHAKNWRGRKTETYADHVKRLEGLYDKQTKLTG